MSVVKKSKRLLQSFNRKKNLNRPYTSVGAAAAEIVHYQEIKFQTIVFISSIGMDCFLISEISKPEIRI